MKKIRTAILGYGRSGSTMHAGALEKVNDFEVTAVSDNDPQRRQQAADRFHCAVYEDYRQMLAHEQLDLAIIVTRSDQHAPMTCDCLAANLNVLVTKPWAINEAEARRMVTAAEQSGKLLFPWLPARWGSDLARLKQLLAEQAIGRVFMIRRVQSSFASRSDWQTERRYGGGYLLNWGPHIVDPPLVLMGSHVASVFGRLQQVFNSGNVEDVFLAILTMADGTVIQAEYTITPNEPPNWCLQGDHGTIILRGDKLQLISRAPASPEDPTKYTTMKSNDNSGVEEVLSGALDGDPSQIYTEIAQAIRGQAPFPVTPNDALELTRVLDAIRISHEENRIVHLQSEHDGH